MFRYIIAMSRSRQEIANKIADASTEIDMHIIKLLLYPNIRTCSHWKQEVVNFLYAVDRLKGSNKWPSEKFIYEYLSCHNDILSNYKMIVEEDYEELKPSDISIQSIEQAVVEYQRYLAHELSNNGIISRKFAYSKLDSILNKYN